MSRRRLLALASLPVLPALPALLLAGPVAAATASPAGAAVAAPSSARAVARQGAAYLAARLGSAGYLTDSTGRVDLADTVPAILALHAAGAGGTAAAAAENYLRSHTAAYLGGGTAGTDDAGRLAQLILAAVASGDSPTAFGTTHTDLVSRLLATQNTYTKDGAVDTGLFGASDPTYDGAYRQGLALAALAAAGVANNAGVTWLHGQQCSNGGWEAYRSSTTTACTAPDPVNFAGEDTNSTALAAEGLVAQHAATGSVVSFLHAVQGSDGGFGYYGGSADPDSTGLVLQALSALGQDASSASWTKGSATPFTALAAFQLGCTTATPGAFYYPGGAKTANLLATTQAIPGAAFVAFPLSSAALAPAAPSSCTSAPSSRPVLSVPHANTTAVATPSPAAATPAAAARVSATSTATLPRTGASATVPLAVVGAALVAAGAGAVGAARRLRRRS